jgi:hypothetical protein
MIEAALIAFIEAVSPSLFNGRIYADVAPQSAVLPYAVISRISRTGIDVYDGSVGVAQHRVQIDIFAASKADLQETGSLIQSTLAIISHDEVPIGGSPEQSIKVQCCRQVTEIDSVEPQTQPAVYRRIQDWLVTWNEGV